MKLTYFTAKVHIILLAMEAKRFRATTVIHISTTLVLVSDFAIKMKLKEKYFMKMYTTLSKHSHWVLSHRPCNSKSEST